MPFRFFVFGILDHCFTRAIVFTNGFNKAAFVSFDGAMINARLVEAVNKRAAAELGIPEGNIMYNWTHTHSGASVSQDELVERTFRAVSMANSNISFRSARLCACSRSSASSSALGAASAPT